MKTGSGVGSGVGSAVGAGVSGGSVGSTVFVPQPASSIVSSKKAQARRVLFRSNLTDYPPNPRLPAPSGTRGTRAAAALGTLFPGVFVCFSDTVFYYAAERHVNTEPFRT